MNIEQSEWERNKFELYWHRTDKSGELLCPICKNFVAITEAKILEHTQICVLNPIYQKQAWNEIKRQRNIIEALLFIHS